MAMEVGKIHVYTGDGKGKTSAAFGLAMRMSGCGGKVSVVQFLKTAGSGELCAVERLAGVSVHRFESGHGFFWEMDDAQKDVLREEVHRAYAFCRELLLSGGCDLLVLDEAIGALCNGLISRQMVTELLDAARGRTELVLTGRNAPEWLIEQADYVSEVRCLKHPFNAGCGARKGIEF